MDLAKNIQKFKSKLVIITGDFYLIYPQITKEDKDIDWLYPKMIEAIKKITDSIILVFSPINLPHLINYK